MSSSITPRPVTWHVYVPKLVTVLRLGYTRRDLRADLVAGLTVSIVALPLAMALAIASGATPEKGLYTAIVAGFLISLLGGSRVQIGGPTAAFVPVVFNVIDKFGYGGLILCTLLAGIMLIAAGVLRIGTLLKYIPQPVITGFTSGIAVSIFSSQIKDLLGLHMDKVPADFFARWSVYFTNLPTLSGLTVALAAGSLVLIVALRRLRPKWPGFLIVVIPARSWSPWSTCLWRRSVRVLEAFLRPGRISRFRTFRLNARANFSPARSPSRSSPASNPCSRRWWPTA
jgi:SulP family sulfate permease